MIDEPAGEYMEVMEFRNAERVHLIALENKKCHGMLLERKDPWHHKDAEGVWSVSLFQNAYKIDESIGELAAESSYYVILMEKCEPLRKYML